MGIPDGIAASTARRNTSSPMARASTVQPCQIGDELRAIHDVGYTSRNPARDGMFRQVVIRPRQEGLIVRAKPGYYAR